jgi:hypothetical protein
MSSNYPDPPTTNDAHYTPIYPANPNPNAQLHGSQGPPRGPYPQEPPFNKIEDLEVLQAHANHALNDQRVLGQHALPPLAQPPPQQKPNRLRKACDSCSIRKVKVRYAHDIFTCSVLTRCSATRRVRRVELASRSKSPAPSTVPVADEDRPTDMPKTSRSGG